MKLNCTRRVLLVALVLILPSANQLIAGPAGSGFTYQGRLLNGTNSANGTYAIKATLYDALSAGNQIATSVTNSALSVSNGLFTMSVDFGAGAFDGNARWLEIGVRTNIAQPFTTLLPRQSITATPYAVSANALSGTLPASQLTGVLPPGLLNGNYGAQLVLTNPGNIFTGNGSGLYGVNAVSLCGSSCINFWNTGGNSGGTGTNFLGTTDNQPFEIRVNNSRAFRLEPQPMSPNFLGGYANNATASGVQGATIAGGGSSGAENILASSFGTISGGSANFLSNGINGTISGGCSNSIRDGFASTRPSSYAVVGGGVGNMIQNSPLATIGGGSNNLIAADSGTLGCTIGGGYGNEISSYYVLNSFGTIAGGIGNAQYLSAYGTIGGGEGNLLDSYSSWATIGGGYSNVNHGVSTTIAGGWDNEIDGNPDFGWSNGASTIGGGAGNFIAFNTTGGESTIAGGAENTIYYTFAQGSGGAIGGGESNLVKGPFSTIAGGSANTALGTDSAIGGGTMNTTTTPYSTVPGGYQARTASYGQMSYASGQFQNAGDAQTSVYVSHGTTTNATQTELFLDGSSQRILVPTNSSWALDILIAGRASNGNTAAYQLRCVLKNNSGVLTLLPAAPASLVLGEDISSWDSTVVIDNPNQAVVVKVTGAAGTTIRWVSTMRTAEVMF